MFADLLGGDGVVLVEDGQGVELQQALDGALDVGGALGVVNVVPRQQDLGHHMAILGKKFVVGIHQLALAHRGGSLLGGHILWPAGEGELSHPHANGAGGDQDELMPGVFQVAEDLAQGLHLPDVQQARGMGQGGGADLDHNALVLHGRNLLTWK